MREFKSKQDVQDYINQTGHTVLVYESDVLDVTAFQHNHPGSLSFRICR